MITTNSDGNAISQSCIDAIRSDSREFLSKLLVNGTEVPCAIDSWTLTKGSCGNIEAFSVGDVFGSVFSAEVRNLSANIKGEDVEVQIGVNTGTEYEYITLGIFNITNVKRTYYSTTITAYGRTVTRTKFAFVPPATQTISDIIDELEAETGCTITLDSGIDDTLEITASMLNMTSYQALSVVASVVGGYVCDTADGNIAIRKFTTTSTLSVGTGMMTQLPDAEEVNFTISGIKCTVSEAVETGDTVIPAVVYTSGSDINVEVASQFMTQDLFDDEFSANLIGYSYRPATINLTLGDPRLEGSDCLSVTDLNGTTYIVPCHSLVMQYAKGFSCVINSAKATLVDDGIGSSSALAMQLTILQSSAHGAKIVADASYQIASDTNQYFWFTSTGSDTGAHITEVPQEEFTDPTSPDYHSGGNLLARSNGIAVRDGMTETAQFGADAVQIGQNSQTRATIDYHSMQLIDMEGNTYFYVSDLRGSDGKAHIVDKFTSNGYRYWLTFTPTSSDYTVTGTNWGSKHIVYKGTEYFDFDDDLPPNATVIAEYDTESEDVKAYTVGMRGTGDVGASSSVVGTRCVASGKFAYAEGLETTADGYIAHAEGWETTADASIAHAEGYKTTADGYIAHAEGYKTTASGDYSHAEGGATTSSGNYSHAQNYITKASKSAQTAVGTCNIEDTSTTTTHPSGNTGYGTYAVIVGNGTSDNARSNALTVDWNGNVDIASGAKYKINGTDLLDIFYPVGSYYETSNANFNPNTAWGGTWSLEAEGKVHIGAGSTYTIGATGGEKTHKLTANESGLQSHKHSYNKSNANTNGHTLAVDEIPSHRHEISYAQYNRGTGSATASALQYTGSTAYTGYTGGGKSHSHSISTTATDTDAKSADAVNAHNNMQPYIVVNRWHRTA